MKYLIPFLVLLSGCGDDVSKAILPSPSNSCDDWTCNPTVAETQKASAYECDHYTDETLHCTDQIINMQVVAYLIFSDGGILLASNGGVFSWKAGEVPHLVNTEFNYSWHVQPDGLKACFTNQTGTYCEGNEQ